MVDLSFLGDSGEQGKSAGPDELLFAVIKPYWSGDKGGRMYLKVPKFLVRAWGYEDCVSGTKELRPLLVGFSDFSRKSRIPLTNKIFRSRLELLRRFREYERIGRWRAELMEEVFDLPNGEDVNKYLDKHRGGEK